MGPFSADHTGKGLNTKRHSAAAKTAVNHFFFIDPFLPKSVISFQQENPLTSGDYMTGGTVTCQAIFFGICGPLVQFPVQFP
jgi:hypothetical protein